VAQSLSMDQLQKLAAYGARTRVEELRAEIAAITKAFPDLVGAGTMPAARRRGRRRGVAAAAAPTANGRRRRRRGKLSAAGRAAISAAQKRRWAAIRKQKASAGKP
jgi:mono/diheme cytochrome c family protein